MNCLKKDETNRRLKIKLSHLRQNLKTIGKSFQAEDQKKRTAKAALVPIRSIEELIEFNIALQEKDFADDYVSLFLLNYAS